MRNLALFLLILVTASINIPRAQAQSVPGQDPAPPRSAGPRQAPKATKPNDAEKARRSEPPAPPSSMKTRKKFVSDVVNAAVALPEGDPQDRLRVLAAAANVMSSVDSKRASEFANEGVQLEIQLVASGKTPAVSIMQRGDMKCSIAQEFVEMVPVASVPAAEQSILGALSSCPSETVEPVKRKLNDAMQNGALAPRALLALMEHEGLKSPWSTEQFQVLFKSLPKDAEKSRDEAPNFAAMLARVAPEIDREAAGEAGLNFLEWLGRLDPGDERNLAVNITTGVLQDVFGEEDYKELLGKNVMAMQVAQTAGQPAEIGHEDEENVSVLRAIDANGMDQSETLRDLPASLRAREAAAHGFASGTGGEMDVSKTYFDMAFSALNDVWEQRENVTMAADVVEEVSEAAAHVDPVMALGRTQELTYPAARAIGMLAVARVALSRQIPDATPRSKDR